VLVVFSLCVNVFPLGYSCLLEETENSHYPVRQGVRLCLFLNLLWDYVLSLRTEEETERLQLVVNLKIHLLNLDIFLVFLLLIVPYADTVANLAIDFKFPEYRKDKLKRKLDDIGI